jgi:hypothetical protein
MVIEKEIQLSWDVWFEIDDKYVQEEEYCPKVLTAGSLPLPKLNPRVPSGIRGPGGGRPTTSEVSGKLV